MRRFSHKSTSGEAGRLDAMLKRKRVTRQIRVMALAQQGLNDWEIAERIGCRESDVRLAKRRASIAAARRKPITTQFRISELARAGVPDAEISAQLGCRLEYVRVARQRLGLSRPRGPNSNRTVTGNCRGP
jgi:hypothetical protein